MSSEPGPGGSATTTIRARSQGPSSRRADQVAQAPSAGRSIGPGAYRGYEDHGHLRRERRCRGRANVMAGHGSGSRDRPRNWRAGLHMATDQHVHRRQGRGAARESGGSRERRVDHDRLRPWYTASASQTEAGRARLAGQQPGILLIECPAIDEVFQLPLTAHSEAFVLDHSRNIGCYATRSTITRQLPCAGDTDASGQPMMPSGRGVRHGCLPIPRRQGSRAAALAGAQPGLDRRRQTDRGSLTGSQRPQARRRSARLDRARISVPNGPVPALAPPSA